MSVIYNITLTLWIVIVVLRIIDLLAFNDKGPILFNRFAGITVLITLCFSVFSAISLIWS